MENQVLLLASIGTIIAFVFTYVGYFIGKEDSVETNTMNNLGLSIHNED